jgi:nucleotide-binding universal stress UspA family protein
VAIDLLGSSTEVVQAALALAVPLQAKVILLNVVRYPPGVNPFAEGPGGQRNDVVLDADAFNDLEPFVALLERSGVTVEKDLAHGDAASGILAAIERHQPGFLVMGTHARTGISRLLQGSVAESVLQRSPVPVLVVHARAAGLDPSE